MFGIDLGPRSLEAALWIGAAVALPAWFALEHYRLSRRISNHVKVKELWVYPIKSCAGFAVQEVQIDDLGFENDRRWMVVKPTGEMMTMREFPQMALIRTRIEDNGATLVVSANNADDIRVPVKEAPTGDKVTVNIWGDSVVAGKLGDELDAWFTRVIGKPAMFVKVLRKGEHKREIDPRFKSGAGDVQVAFSDGYPLLLANKGSLNDLNNRLKEKVGMRNFRPNIVVENCPPWEEDFWGHLRIGSQDFDVVKPCDRCAMPTVNPDTGKYSPDIEPTKTLRTFRSVGESVIFGQNVIQRKSSGSIKVGDDVKILSTHLTSATWLSV